MFGSSNGRMRMERIMSIPRSEERINQLEKYCNDLQNENSILRTNVRELQEQLQKAYIRIKELTDE